MKTPLLYAIILSVVACSCDNLSNAVTPDAASLDAAVDGAVVVYPIGQRFVLTLDAHGSAGYLWEWQIGDTAVVSLDGEPSYRRKGDGPIVPGGAMVADFPFACRQPGKCTIRMKEVRPWLPDEAPLSSVVFTVVVVTE